MRTLLVIATGVTAWAQQPSPSDGIRGMWSTEFRKARTESSQTPPKPMAKPAGPPVAATLGGVKPAPPAAALLGVTVWLLRPSKPADPAAVRAIVHENGNRPHTPVRVSATTRFFEGDHLRLSVESGRPGYLYVVSRERYADGSFGAHQLIFPTTRLRDGDNRVRAGYPVELPSLSDDPSYFTLRRARPNHTGEEILFIVAPRPLAQVTVGEEPIELNEAMVKGWQEQWTTKIQSIETPDRLEQPLSKDEVDRMRDRAGFRENDPLPQTLYRVESLPDRPFLVALQLAMNQPASQ